MPVSSYTHVTRRTMLTLPLISMMTGSFDKLHAQETKKVAAIITEYRRNSHADVIIGRMLEGYSYYGKNVNPRVKIFSMFTDRVPDNDMSREKASQYGVPIVKTISEALTMGSNTMAVDGVVLIGEHGNYHWNLKEQHLYPRWWLYKQIVDVFRRTGKTVPVFCDKHLSVDWDEAKWMYNQSYELGFPLMAGSSVPLSWREPEIELKRETPMGKAVMTSYGGKDAYGFHALEALQCMAERRVNGETGIEAVQCLEGAPVWLWTDIHPWAVRLLDEALTRCPKAKNGSPRDTVKWPILFLIDYRDGFQAAVYILNGHVSSWAFAADIRGKAEPVSMLFHLQGERPYGHFSSIVHYIEELILTQREQYPVERTLLTTGILSALMSSSWYDGRKLEEGRRITTPLLNMTYKAPGETFFNRGPMPVAQKDFGIGP